MTIGFNSNQDREQDKGQEQNDGVQDMLRSIMEQVKKDDSVIRAVMNDQRLVKMAEYDVTHGYTVLGADPSVFQDKFHEFKRLVLSGEITLKVLEDQVYTKWGIQEPPREEAAESERRPIGFTSAPTVDDNLPTEVADIPDDSPDNH